MGHYPSLSAKDFMLTKRERKVRMDGKRDSFIGIVLGFSYFCSLITSAHMKYSETQHFQEGYVTPSIRIVDLEQDQSFLTSNLEPIDGGDDPDIDW